MRFDAGREAPSAAPSAFDFWTTFFLPMVNGYMLFKVHFLFAAAGGLSHVAMSGAGIALGALAADRQVAGVAGAAIRLQGFQPLYVLAHKLAKLSFYAVVLLDDVFDAVHL